MAHLTREEVLQSGVMSEEYQKAVSARPHNLEATDFFQLRTKRVEHLQKLRHLYPISGPIPEEVTETIHSVSGRDGHAIQVKVYVPLKGPPKGGSPLVIMFHEGGWSMGDLTDEDMNCRMFARDLGCVCVNVEYRLAPEHPFPAGIHDSWDALVWAVNNAGTFHANPHDAGLIVGGASAGGNIAAVLALLARDKDFHPRITGQYLCVPALLHASNVPPHLTHLYTSRTQNTLDPVLKVMPEDIVADIYKPDPKSPLWDPFIHPKGHHRVAKAFFQVGGLDPLRDEAVLYDGALREAGVLTRFDLYAGFGHMFWTNYPELDRSKRFVEDTVRGMKWLLEK